eukprot:Gb_04951 [translate_table: standard]
MDQVCTVPLSSACASSSLPLPARRLDPYLGPWSKIDRRFRHRAIKRPFLSGCAPDLKLLRRGLLKGIGVSGISMCVSVLSEASVEGVERLPFKPEGYNFWTWRGHKIHYVVEGEGRPIVLIHGFGASAFHWRYNIPQLAKVFKVYAIDLLGFGWSDKAVIDYNAFVWRDQVADFLKEIVRDPAILVGNSLGGFTALITAADCQEFVSGVALLNSAGQFGNPEEQAKNDVKETAIQRLIFNPLKQLVQRAVLSFAFWQAKQPSRIQSVLKSVYPNPTNVDDYLVESIIKPADDPTAGEVYYRLMTQFMFSPSKVTLDGLLEKLSCPLLLLWGDLDPWVGPSKANKIKELYPNSSLVNLKAGHCPHDEVPELVNEALINWALPLGSPVPSQGIYSS